MYRLNFNKKILRIIKRIMISVIRKAKKHKTCVLLRKIMITKVKYKIRQNIEFCSCFTMKRIKVNFNL